MNEAVPIWVWPPGATEPVQAASLAPENDLFRFTYLSAYTGASKNERGATVPLDPVSLRFKKGTTLGKLPGVVLDAKPAGYGQDRLNAALHAKYKRDLTDLELLEEGPADGVGAIEACRDINRKLRWRASSIDVLSHELEKLEADAPASRAMRRANGDMGTSAGGERPKATFVDDGRLWLVKMQDRGDRPGMPAMEHVAMSLAGMADVTVPALRLKSVGPHQAFMVERFDREGEPTAPRRHLFASAHTVLQLPGAAVRGDPRRSYLALADKMRVWCKGSDQLVPHRQELWRRMAFNALVGNTDDHPRNHGLLFKNGAWQLSPAFDITPVWRQPHGDAGTALSLAMDTGIDGGTGVDAFRLIAAAEHFDVDPSDACAYLLRASALVNQHWEPMLRSALSPVEPHRPKGYTDQVIDDVRAAFALSRRYAEQPAAVEHALVDHLAPRKRGRRHHP